MRIQGLNNQQRYGEKELNKMAIYRVHYSGDMDVIADSEEEARRNFYYEDFIRKDDRLEEIEYLNDGGVLDEDFEDISSLEEAENRLQMLKKELEKMFQ